MGRRLAHSSRKPAKAAATGTRKSANKIDTQDENIPTPGKKHAPRPRKCEKTTKSSQDIAPEDAAAVQALLAMQEKDLVLTRHLDKAFSKTVPGGEDTETVDELACLVEKGKALVKVLGDGEEEEGWEDMEEVNKEMTGDEEDSSVHLDSCIISEAYQHCYRCTWTH